jgi:hypothetical protein
MKLTAERRADLQGGRKSGSNIHLVQERGPADGELNHELLVRLCHPPDGSTSPKYKLLCFKPP